MAKKWTPTQKQLSFYDELLRRQNEVRKQVLRRRRIAEEGGTFGSLPDLVIPMKAKRYRDLSRYHFDSYAEYRKARQRLSELYGGKSPLKTWYKTAYKGNIMAILKDWIENKYGYKETPEDKKQWNSKEPTLYSDFQIENAPEGLSRLLEIYNLIEKTDISVFMAMYDLKSFPSLHIIYDDVTGEANFGEVDRFINDFEYEKRRVMKSAEYRALKEELSRNLDGGYINDYQKSVENRSAKRLAEIQNWTPNK